MHFMGTIFNKLICFVVSMPRSSRSSATGATPVVQTPLPSFKDTLIHAGTTSKKSGATETPKCKDFINFSSKLFICLCITGYFNWKILNFLQQLYLHSHFIQKEGIFGKNTVEIVFMLTSDFGHGTK